MPIWESNNRKRELNKTKNKKIFNGGWRLKAGKSPRARPVRTGRVEGPAKNPKVFKDKAVYMSIQRTKMAPTKKTSTAPATPAAAAPAATPSTEKKVVEKKATAAAAPVAATPAATVVATPAAVDEAATGSAFEDFSAKFAALGALLKETQAALKVLSKDYARMEKTVAKSERKRANARVNPNGFAKPTLITDALCDFLSLPKGSELSRTDVTRKINAYIKEKSLNKPENKRIILPDEKLRKLLNVKASEEVSFFHLQRYLSPLFVKKVTV